MYWTPDNSCYTITHIFEATSLAFIEGGASGIRFKIRAEITNVTCYDRTLYTRHETYLYLADNRYCEKGFIDDRYGHAHKKYIPVTLDIFPGGEYELLCFWVDDSCYKVEKTIDIKPHASFYAGGIGIRHKVEARLVKPVNDDDPQPCERVHRQASLYLELNKWFIPIAA